MSTALITGASTGIGKATALRLARSGWTVLAGVRDSQAGERLRAEAGADGRVVPVSLDVTDAGQVAAAGELVSERTGTAGLDALVNNAGIAVGGPLEVIDLEELRRQYEVNVFAQVAVMQAMMPALRRARGRIALVSSIGGRVALPYTSPYNSSKHALEAIGDALRVELRRSGVQVALIEPGSVATPIWGKGRAEVERVTIPPGLEGDYGHIPEAMEKVLRDTERRGVPPERVAQTIERALGARRMRSRYMIGLDTRAMLLMTRLMPDRVFDRVIARALGV